MGARLCNQLGRLVAQALASHCCLFTGPVITGLTMGSGCKVAESLLLSNGTSFSRQNQHMRSQHTLWFTLI